jgi:hypothetical protein
MASFTITHAWRLDGYGVVQVLEHVDGLIVGSDINISGLATTNLNGNHTVYSLENYSFTGVTDEGDLLFNTQIERPNQILFADAGDDIDRQTDSGTLQYTPTCTWIDSDDVSSGSALTAPPRTTPRLCRPVSTLPTPSARGGDAAPATSTRSTPRRTDLSSSAP